jgi:hypothetical protein
LTGALTAGLLTFGAAQVWHDAEGLLTLWGGLTLAGTAGSWVFLLRDSRALLWSLERLTGRDLDGDGTRGDPAKRRLEVHVKEGGHTRIVGADWLGLDDANLIAFAQAVHKGRKALSEGAWGKDRACFPRGVNQYRAVRSKLVEAGMIRLANPATPSQGYTWTPAGRAMVKRLAEDRAHARAQGEQR